MPKHSLFNSQGEKNAKDENQEQRQKAL